MIDKKLESISLIKTSMMIAVVLCHCMYYFGGEWFQYSKPVYNANYLYSIATWINTFHIQTFTMVSGFLFYYLKLDKNRYKQPKNDIKKRAKRLIIPYIFTCMLWVIPIGYYFFNYSNSELINKFVLMVAPAQLWFLIMLFFVFIFFEFFSDKIIISFKNLILLYIVCTSASLLLSFYKINYFQLSRSCQYLLYFYLGGYIFKNKEKISVKQIIIMAIMAILFYCSYLFLNSANSRIYQYGSMFILPIVSILEVFIIYYVFSFISKKKIINFNNKIYKLLEDNSFGIYLFHQQIIYFTIILLNGVVHPIIQVLLSFIISLTISLIMSILLKKNKITKTMFGI